MPRFTAYNLTYQACGPQILADHLTFSQPGVADYAHHINTGSPGFSDLPSWIQKFGTRIRFPKGLENILLFSKRQSNW